MALQPSETDIQSVINVTDISRAEAIARLKNNNNNAEQAIGEFYDDGESARKRYANVGWDDSHFGADRDGAGTGVVGSQGVSFQVQGPDDYGPNGAPGRFNDALSRPPSRVANRSPLGNVIDLTAESAMGNPQNPMYYGANTQQEDDELERALAASREEAGLPPQQSGTASTVNVNEVHFGPATQDQYEHSQWAMVPTSRISSQEVLPDPDPADRKRDLDVPAFLKPGVSENRLAGLLTMYHTIPLTRELFLDRDTLIPTYGSDQEWWNGTTIKLEPLGLAPGTPYKGEVRLELQRLMAFLDKTDRSYGSVDQLTKMNEVLKTQRTVPNCRDVEPAVLDVWSKDNIAKPSRVDQIYSHGVSGDSKFERDEEVFAILDLSLPLKDSHMDTIYDIADDLLWRDFGSSDLMESAYLSHVSEVFVFRIAKDGSDSKAIDIPSVWYPNRYLLENRQEALNMRMAKKEAYQQIERLNSVQEMLTVFQARNGKEFKVKDLLATSLKHDEAEINKDTESDGDDMEGSFHRSSKTSSLSSKLQQVVASIDRKLQALEEEKVRTLNSMRNLSSLYTEEDDTVDSSKLTKYFLRGVSTKKDVTYICRRAEPDLIEMDLDAEAPKDLGDQWWRCAYVVEGGSARAIVEKTTEEEVLHAAKHEAPKQLLLMYASEKALQEEIRPLPPPLEAFVKMDNQYFKREFPASSDVTPPGKRKFDDSSDHESPTTRDSDRELRLNGEPELGWAGVQSAAREMNSQLNGQEEEGTDSGLEALNDEGGILQQEMQQRERAPLLANMDTSGADSGSASTIDDMEIDDRVVEDENVVGDSAAVQKVGSRS